MKGQNCHGMATAVAERKFFYVDGARQRRGPLTGAQLKEYWAGKYVNEKTYVFSADGTMANWTPIPKVEDLYDFVRGEPTPRRSLLSMAELSSSVSQETRDSCSSVSQELTSQTVSQETRDSCSSVSQELTSQTVSQEARDSCSSVSQELTSQTVSQELSSPITTESPPGVGTSEGVPVVTGDVVCVEAAAVAEGEGASESITVVHGAPVVDRMVSNLREASLSFREASRNSPLSWPSDHMAAFHARRIRGETRPMFAARSPPPRRTNRPTMENGACFCSAPVDLLLGNGLWLCLNAVPIGIMSALVWATPDGLRLPTGDHETFYNTTAFCDSKEFFPLPSSTYETWEEGEKITVFGSNCSLYNATHTTTEVTNKALWLPFICTPLSAPLTLLHSCVPHLCVRLVVADAVVTFGIINGYAAGKCTSSGCCVPYVEMYKCSEIAVCFFWPLALLQVARCGAG